MLSFPKFTVAIAIASAQCVQGVLLRGDTLSPLEKAAKAYEEALKAHLTAQEEAVKARGEAAEAIKRHEEAVKAIEEAKKIHESNIQSRLDKLNSTDRGKRALALNPDLSGEELVLAAEAIL